MNIDAHLADLVEFLKFPSISTESSHAADVRACGQWLAEKMRSIGLSADLHETARHPVVLGRNDDGHRYLEVRDVVPGSPSDLAGVKVGHRVVRIAGQPSELPAAAGQVAELARDRLET